MECQDRGEAAPVPNGHPLSVPSWSYHQSTQIGCIHRADGKDPRVSGQASTLSTTVRVIFFSFRSLFSKVRKRVRARINFIIKTEAVLRMLGCICSYIII